MMMRAYVAGAVVLLIAAVTGCFGPKRAEVADLAPPAVPPCTAPAAALTMSPPPRALTQQAASSNAPGRPSVLRGAVRRAAIRAHQAPATQPSEADSPAALPLRAIEMLSFRAADSTAPSAPASLPDGPRRSRRPARVRASTS